MHDCIFQDFYIETIKVGNKVKMSKQHFHQTNNSFGLTNKVHTEILTVTEGQ